MVHQISFASALPLRFIFGAFGAHRRQMAARSRSRQLLQTGAASSLVLGLFVTINTPRPEKGTASAVAVASKSHRRRPLCSPSQTSDRRSAVGKHLHGYHGCSRHASSHSRPGARRAPSRDQGPASLAARPRPVYYAAAWKTPLRRSSGWPPDRIAQTISCALSSRGNHQ